MNMSILRHFCHDNNHCHSNPPPGGNLCVFVLLFPF